MKIAIVAPSGVPYTVGGAEKLWWGLLDTLRRRPGTEVELVKIPAPERDFAEVVSSYRLFSELALDHFDLVISTKYPAWMIDHPCHYVYLQHRLRGLYDTYPAALPLDIEEQPAAAATLCELLRRPPTIADRGALFDELATLRRRLDDAGWQALFPFPGPLSRAVVHWLDASALRAGPVKKFMAISRTVRERPGYFPDDALVQVIHHPSDLAPAEPGAGRYLLAVSRLEAPKRLDLLIRAMRHVTADLELRIAGTGPDEASLRQLAASDGRVRFCGRVEDAELRRLYSQALAVAFFPAEEDFGLITVEAMQAGVPVLTTVDAGGPTELVTHGETGWVVEPDAAALGRCLQRIAENPAGCAAMADACRQRVADIHWPATVEALLDTTLRYDNDGFLEAGKPRKIVVAVSFPIYPAASGGANRIFHLYRHVARHTPVTLVTLCSSGQAPLDEVIAPGLREIRVPKSVEQEQLEHGLEQRLGASVGDVVAMRHIELTPAYLLALREACLDADLAIASHPYLYPALRMVWRGRVLYEAHNVEVDMKRDILGDGDEAQGWLALTDEVEGACCRDSVGVAACSEADRRRLVAHYGIDPQAVAVVPNGADLESLPYTGLHDRRRVQARLAAAPGFSVLFMGSWHGPNIEAARFVCEVLAPALPALQFWIVGTVCRSCEPVSDNVRLFGALDDADKNAVLACAWLALNPVVSGSGSNLKMAEYLGAGLPVLSTPHGARGLDIAGTGGVWLEQLGNFPEKLKKLVNDLDTGALKGKVGTGPGFAPAGHDWRVIAEKYYAFIVSTGLNLETLC